MSIREAATDVLYTVYCTLGELDVPVPVLDLAYEAVNRVAED